MTVDWACDKSQNYYFNKNSEYYTFCIIKNKNKYNTKNSKKNCYEKYPGENVNNPIKYFFHIKHYTLCVSKLL